MLDIMYEQSEDVASFPLMDGVYTGIFIASAVIVTGLFLWGLFGKKPKLARKIIFAELLLLFLYLNACMANVCFHDIRVYLHDDVINAHMFVKDLCQYLFKVSILSAVSLCKLILLLLLSIKIAIKRKKPNQNVEPIVTTPIESGSAQSTQAHV